VSFPIGMNRKKKEKNLRLTVRALRQV
jgi:hypothetical protein